jgi:MFS family permease
MSDNFNPTDSPYPRESELVSHDFGAVESPYAGRKVKTSEHLYISALWFASNFQWGALLILLLPNQVRNMVPEHRATVLGLVQGLAAVIAILVPLIVGALSDRCFSKMGRRRPYIFWGILINVVGLGLMYAAYSATKPVPIGAASGPLDAIAQSPGIIVYFLAYLIVQLGNNIATAAYSGLIPDLIEPSQRGVASGFMALMSQLGTLLGAIACGLLLGSASEAVKFGLIAAILLVMTALTVFGVKERSLPQRPPKIEWVPYIKSLWISPTKFPNFAWVWITRALVMLGFYSIQPYINYYLIDRIGVSPKDIDGVAPILLGVILIASCVSGIYGGVLSDKIGRKRVVYYANAMIAVMALGFIFCTTGPQVLAVGVLFGLGYGAYVSVDWALGTEVLPSKDNAAKEMAVWHIAMTLPQTIGAPIAGFALAAYGTSREIVPGVTDPVIHYQAPGYATIFIICAVCCGLGAVLLRNVRGVR